MRTRGLCFAVLLALLVGGLTACRPATVGARCSGTELGRDSSHVLVCRNGRWQRATTIDEAARLLRNLDRVPVTGVQQISAGSTTTCALLADHTVECWGANDTGQIGAGTVGGVARTPTTVIGLTGVTAISMGADFGCAIVGGGGVRCWGGNEFGQVQPNGSPTIPMPVAVVGVSGATAIAAGARHACALVGGGAVTCWGSNDGGQLGNGVTGGTAGPFTVSGISGATQIAAGDALTCAVVSGAAYCWGVNLDLTLGIPSTYYDLTPELVPGLDDAAVVELALANTSNCAVLAGGKARCWTREWALDVPGYIPPPAVAKDVANLWGAIGVDASSNHRCATYSGGKVACWGSNSNGELGDGTTASHGVATGVSGITSATDVVTGNSHSCALLADTTVACWGNNYSRQIDDRLGLNALLPTVVTRLRT